MRILLALLLLLLAASPATAQDRPPDFVTVVFHQVVERQEELESDAITTIELIRFFDWLKGNGWTAISLDDLEAARTGAKALPPKSILITFDDGYESVYAQAYPLLLAYRYPAVVAVVGDWVAGAPGSMVRYGNKWLPRTRFLSWDEMREMTASGLVEIASHSYALHETVQANPQGNMQPAAATWRYDPNTGTYEADAAYRLRIRSDLEASRRQFAQELGKPPRALVWPFGRYTGPAMQAAKAAGFTYLFTLQHAPDRLDQLDRIGRDYPVAADKLANIATEIAFEPPKADALRIACLTLDRLAAAKGPDAQDAALGRMIESVRALGVNTLVLDAQAALPTADAPLGAVFFPTRLRPVAADLLNRVVWQMRTRADVDAVYLRLPFAAARAAVSADVGALYADLFRAVPADGLVLDASPELTAFGDDAADQPSSTRWDLSARRNAANPDAEAWQAYRAAASIAPNLRLMLTGKEAAARTRWPAPLADVLLLPAGADPAQLQAAHWFEPRQSGRVALTLPADSPAAAMRAAQAQGATAFALCPGDAVLEDPALLSHSFSAASYPLKP
ncbi:poly-beta-1,6-N-acetyl-D-glucosamine N-deacetylase PgaB [Dongia sp.]|uniref:poly-beta-1,6-N-acetyl-D-glucosamine N-deacetylase PgaB n=1 Tax=Dongia sp. TaxID=1977262 RepID=UPI003750E331